MVASVLRPANRHGCLKPIVVVVVVVVVAAAAAAVVVVEVVTEILKPFRDLW